MELLQRRGVAVDVVEYLKTPLDRATFERFLDLLPDPPADYILYYKPNIPVAIIEAKDNNGGLGDGMQQALGYAEMIDVSFVFSSNGDAFLFHDRTGQSPTLETEIALRHFLSPDDPWRQYCTHRGITTRAEPVVTQDYYPDGGGKSPRYHQLNAVNRVIEAVAKGQDRTLLVMATGTGKTYTAFQIIWRLWKAGVKKRILFLADRNILVDQTKTNDFKPFGGGMTRITNRRLAAFPIRLPRLRDRAEDIPMLGERHKKHVPGFLPAALEQLVRWTWPGNVCELQKEVERAVALVADGQRIGPELLSPRLTGGGAETVAAEAPAEELVPLRDARERFEVRYVASALRRFSGAVSHTAQALGISRVMLQKKMKQCGLREES